MTADAPLGLATSVASSPTPASPARLGFWLLIGIIASVGVSKAVQADILDPDCFWHLRVAEQLQREGIHPIVDHLSYASIKEPWIPYSWLAELGMKRLWNTGGYRLALIAHALMVALTIVFAALACLQLAHRSPEKNAPTGSQQSGAPSRSASSLAQSTRYMSTVLATTFFAYLSLPYLSFRPATAAITLLAICAYLLLRDRAHGERTKSVWLVVPITALMINVHLIAIVIPMWMAALLLGSIIERRILDSKTGALIDKRHGPLKRAMPLNTPDRGSSNPESEIQNPKSRQRYALLLAATTIACLATPLLPGVVQTAWHYQSRDVMVASQLITEMRPIYSGIGGAITMILVALVFLSAWRGRGKLRIGEGLWLLVGLVLMLRLGRFAPIFALIAAPVLAATMPALSDKPLTRRPIQIIIAIALLSFAARVAARFPSRDLSLCEWLDKHENAPFRYPCAAADFVEASIAPRLASRPGRLINEFNWGGFLEWRLGSQFQTLLDGRTQLFTPDFWQHTLLAPDENTLENFLKQQNADAAILPTDKSRFRPALEKLGWISAHKDDIAEVYLPPEKTHGRAVGLGGHNIGP